MNESKKPSKRKRYLLGTALVLSSMLLGAGLYWAYAPHPVRCLYCNQPCAHGSDATCFFGHENYLHYECVEPMTELLRRTDTSLFDFMVTKGDQDKPLEGS